MVGIRLKAVLFTLALASSAGCSAVKSTAFVNDNILESGVLAQPVSPGTYINISVHPPEDKGKSLLSVLWIDANGVVKWRGSLASASPLAGVREAVVPVMEPTTIDNVLQIGNHKIKFTVEHPLQTMPTVPHSSPTGEEKKDASVAASDKFGSTSAGSSKLMDLFLLGFAPDILDDSPLSRDMAVSLLPLRSVMRETPSSLQIQVGDDVLRQKIERALITEAGVWPTKGSLPDVVVVSADKAHASRGHKLTIQVEGEQDIPQLVSRVRELFPPPITISDTHDNPVPAKVHAFRVGSGKVFFIDPLVPAPPVLVVHSREPASWSDVRRGVVLGTGTETALPGNLPSPHVIAMLPYTVMRLDAKVEASVDGGMLFRIAVIADKPVTAPHIVTVQAVDQNGKPLSRSFRAIRLKRGAARRWYQWGDEDGRRAAAVIFRDVLTGCSTELSVGSLDRTRQ